MLKMMMKSRRETSCRPKRMEGAHVMKLAWYPGNLETAEKKAKVLHDVPELGPFAISRGSPSTF